MKPQAKLDLARDSLGHVEVATYSSMYMLQLD